MLDDKVNAMIKPEDILGKEWFQEALGIVLVALVAFTVLKIVKRWLHKLGKSGGLFYTVIRIFVWSIALLVVLSNLGYDISSLIAGLGITGIALALAAQETLSNAFGSLSILIDKPFKTGDPIRVDKYEGTVLSIGLRSTLLETKEKTIVSIPNKIVASSPIENLKK
ncbi:hypothetical protein A2974_03450 [Candidatus Peregrinibacteria bacterium RIFCSPLOWO2_01_FULL_48_20]|nr:MAG: hypothetical protein A2974_03450 [Candidatus Peregrinibacteria bacterium RIFCSPLOWO2_01_FULL_48_20]